MREAVVRNLDLKACGERNRGAKCGDQCHTKIGTSVNAPTLRGMTVFGGGDGELEIPIRGRIGNKDQAIRVQVDRSGGSAGAGKDHAAGVVNRRIKVGDLDAEPVGGRNR